MFWRRKVNHQAKLVTAQDWSKFNSVIYYLLVPWENDSDPSDGTNLLGFDQHSTKTPISRLEKTEKKNYE